MHIVIRSQPGILRSAMSFGLSSAIHGAMLAWLALSPALAPEPRLSLYEMEIKPHETHIVWYNVRERLPDVTPAHNSRDPRPPRALRKFNQDLAAGAKDNARAPQMIFMPAPEIHTPKPLPLPNVLAVAPPPRPLRTFTPPMEKRAPNPPPVLPDAPRVTPVVESPSLPLAAPPARPLKTFTPPPVAPVRIAPAAIAEAPAIAAPNRARTSPLPLPDPRAPLRRFTPPKPADPAPAAPAPLPEAPAVAAANHDRNLPLPVPDPRAPLRHFVPPASSQPVSPTGLPAAPAVDAPPAEATLAIVGLNPSKAPDFPTPPGSRQAGFSGGPQPRKQGGEGAAEDGTIVVPWLTARGGAEDSQPTLVVNPDPTAHENLLAVARNALRTPLPDPAMPSATRVASAPDPRLEGRAVYSIALQMPNVTSYSGSWIVWFAERTPVPGAPPPEVRAPVPLRKVDPKYVAEAVHDRIEGSVRLFAVIRHDGHVESVQLLRHLDDRLDRSAEEALVKWVFEPALRNGTPMDVEAVFEIPFHLAPRPAR